jgi:hypothetical protein
MIRTCENIHGTNVVTVCRLCNEEASFLTTISFVGVLASSNSVSGLSAFGTISSAMVKTRYAAASRVALAWRRNMSFTPVIAEGTYEGKTRLTRKKLPTSCLQHCAQKDPLSREMTLLKHNSAKVQRTIRHTALRIRTPQAFTLLTA